MRFLAGILAVFSAILSGGVFARPVSFTNEVMAVLSKSGCNAGGCHGNQDGKGSFKLSLWGDDPAADYQALLDSGKRVNRGDPLASRILRKPTLQVEHEGNKRFEVDSMEYRILQDWIEGGAVNDRDDAPSLRSISVSPSYTILTTPRDSVPLSVEAVFSDGMKRDVTRWALFESSSLEAEVTSEGRLTFMQPGETTVFVRYLGARSSMRAGMIDAREDFKWRGPQPSNGIDDHVFAKLKKFRQNPALRCDDATFLRRVSLDITGTLPEPDEVEKFLNQKDPAKRGQLVDRLLKTREYSEFWALKWADLLRVEEKTLDRNGVEKFYGWLRDSLDSGMGLDQLAREILSATGSTYSNPPANYYRALRRPDERAEATAQVFLGSRLRCAKCHNHPFTEVSQDDYYRFAALFDGIDYEIIENKRKDKHDKHQFLGEQKVRLVALDQLDAKLVLKHPRTKKAPDPGMLDREAPPLVSRDKRLDEMAAWVTGHENFARVQANRIWFHMTGRALIDPVDDVRETNPSSNPQLTDFLERELRNHGYQSRHLIRLIASSRTYQLSADPGRAMDVGAEENFARSTIRRYPAEVVIDAAHRALGVASGFTDAHKSPRAVAMPGVESVHLSGHPGHGERFLKLFGKPARLTNSDSERSDETTLAQVFELTGGETLNRLLQQDDNRIGRMIKEGRDDSEIVDVLYRSVLTRRPSEHEKRAMRDYLDAGNDRRAACEDIAWSLLNAKEFILRQ